ncbi:hypothetical protein GCM10027040_00460 [Halomonas shantousis]
MPCQTRPNAGRRGGFYSAAIRIGSGVCSASRATAARDAKIIGYRLTAQKAGRQLAGAAICL